MPNEQSSPAAIGRADSTSEPMMAQIFKTLQGLRYGVVSIVVHDGVVVQIDRTEKHRLRTCEIK